MSIHPLCLIALSLLGCVSHAPADPGAADSPDQRNPNRIIATFNGRAISEEDVQSTSLGALIIAPLFDQYRSDKRITASREEVESCIRCMLSVDGAPGSVPDVQAVDEGTLQFATDMVLDWKTSKQMHADFGGVVVFQQLNPLEPVGAYLAFLREQESRGTFCIHDAESAADFWHYFVRDHGTWVVAPEDVDYSVPWWEKTPSASRGGGE